MTAAAPDAPSIESPARPLVLEHPDDPDYDHPDTRPTLRGWLHLGTFFLSIVMAAGLIPMAAMEGGRAALAVSIYCAFMSLMFGTSALYHRRQWSARGWKVMKRLDHSMIFLFIAGTYTPFGLLSLEGSTAWWVLGVVWTGCALGVALKVLWPTAPRWVGVPLYVAIGWVAIFVMGDIGTNAGITGMILLMVGGVLYSLGGFFYAIHWPNPKPGVFGYHEVFHACTVVAAICQYIAVYFAVYGSPLL